MANSITNPMNNNHDENLRNLGEPGAGPAERAADVASSVGEMAKDAASYVGYKAEEDAAAYVGETAGNATAAVGGSLKSLGETVREQLPQSGMVGEASCAGRTRWRAQADTCRQKGSRASLTT